VGPWSPSASATVSVPTLGPGHGKAVVVAYFLYSTKPRAWIEGVLPEAGSPCTIRWRRCCWRAAEGLSPVSAVRSVREVRNVEIVSYTLILLIGLWRLWAG